jgi:hypothetical protein
MALPPLVNGMLPSGIYPASLHEIWAVFDHGMSITRPALNLALQHAATLIWSRDVAATLYVNGSYVTDRVDPVDVDLAVRSDTRDDAFFLTAFSARHPGEEWLVDGYFNTTRSTQHMEDLFQEIQGSTVRKGIIQRVP